MPNNTLQPTRPLRRLAAELGRSAVRKQASREGNSQQTRQEIYCKATCMNMLDLVIQVETNVAWLPLPNEVAIVQIDELPPAELITSAVALIFNRNQFWS